MQILDSGVVFCNAKPHLRALNAWHPTIACDAGGQLVVAMDLGQGAESFDYQTHLTRSEDGGKSWSIPQPFMPPHATRRANSLARIGQLKDGSLLAWCAYLHREHDDEGFVHRGTGGYVPTELFTMRSCDHGRTWSAPHMVRTPVPGPWEICHRVIELHDGRLLAPMSIWRDWHGHAPHGMKAVALVSRDHGQTWPEMIDIFDDYARGIINFEVSVTQLSDKRLLAVSWAFNEKAGRHDPNPFVISEDGRSFGLTRPIGIRGQTAKLLSLADNQVLCVYRRVDLPGLWAQQARIEGDHWRALHEVAIWEGASARATFRENLSSELEDLKCGFPQMAIMPDHSIMVVHWCYEQGLYVIRYARLGM